MNCELPDVQAGFRTDFWTIWKKVRVGWSERIALKHVYYKVWNRSPVQVGCMRQVLGAGALGWPRGMGWGGTWEGGSGWGTHVNPWLIHVNVWQEPLQYCKVVSLQLIKVNEKKKKKERKRKGRGTRGQVANILWIIEKAREFQKTICFCFIDYAKPLTVWITITFGKFWKRWEYQATWPPCYETYM